MSSRWKKKKNKSKPPKKGQNWNMKEKDLHKDNSRLQQTKKIIRLFSPARHSIRPTVLIHISSQLFTLTSEADLFLISAATGVGEICSHSSKHGWVVQVPTLNRQVKCSKGAPAPFIIDNTRSTPLIRVAAVEHKRFITFGHHRRTKALIWICSNSAIKWMPLIRAAFPWKNYSSTATNKEINTILHFRNVWLQFFFFFF